VFFKYSELARCTKAFLSLSRFKSPKFSFHRGRFLGGRLPLLLLRGERFLPNLGIFRCFEGWVPEGAVVRRG